MNGARPSSPCGQLAKTDRFAKYEANWLDDSDDPAYRRLSTKEFFLLQFKVAARMQCTRLTITVL